MGENTFKEENSSIPDLKKIENILLMIYLGELQMGKLKKTIKEIHLYENKIESLIKVVIWIISWIGGILVLLGTENKEILGSAYFIYMLSLLMEFVPKIDGKTQFWSKLLHTLLCFMMSIVCLLSVGILFGVALPDLGYTVMSVLTIIVIVYMVVDSFVLWLEPENSLVEVNNNSDRELGSQELKFSERLLEGNLGNIDKGAGSNG